MFMREACHTCHCDQTFADIWTYSAVAGFFLWIHWALLANPVVTWLGTLPMGHLFNMTQKAISERVLNQDARGDVISYGSSSIDRIPRASQCEISIQRLLAAVGAGSDTVACGLQSFIYHMIYNPDAWDRVRKEIYDARAAGRCHDRVISNADVQQLE
jgi:cytochrome P450